MKKALIFDFDNTITNSDTLKIILYELIKLNPLRFFKILLPVLSMLVIKDQNLIQFKKNHIIGLLIKNKSHKSIERAINNYQFHIADILRQEIIKHIKEKINLGYICLVVSASPTIFVSSFIKVINEDNIYVIGTDFSTNDDGVYDGKLCGLNCYGKNKPKKINVWKDSFSTFIDFEESWSDSYSDKPMMEMAKKKFWVADKKNFKSFHSTQDDYKVIFFKN